MPHEPQLGRPQVPLLDVSGVTSGYRRLQVLWGVDGSIADDIVIVFGYVARINAYPDTLGFNAEFQSIVRGWRPELAD